MFNFLVKYAVRMSFLAFVSCINIQFFLCHILCVQKENECVPGRNDALWIHPCSECEMNTIVILIVLSRNSFTYRLNSENEKKNFQIRYVLIPSYNFDLSHPEE